MLSSPYHSATEFAISRHWDSCCVIIPVNKFSVRYQSRLYFMHVCCVASRQCGSRHTSDKVKASTEVSKSHQQLLRSPPSQAVHNSSRLSISRSSNLRSLSSKRHRGGFQKKSSAPRASALRGSGQQFGSSSRRSLSSRPHRAANRPKRQAQRSHKQRNRRLPSPSLPRQRAHTSLAFRRSACPSRSSTLSHRPRAHSKRQFNSPTKYDSLTTNPRGRTTHSRRNSQQSGMGNFFENPAPNVERFKPSYSGSYASQSTSYPSTPTYMSNSFADTSSIPTVVVPDNTTPIQATNELRPAYFYASPEALQAYYSHLQNVNNIFLQYRSMHMSCTDQVKEEANRMAVTMGHKNALEMAFFEAQHLAKTLHTNTAAGDGNAWGQSIAMPSTPLSAASFALGSGSWNTPLPSPKLSSFSTQSMSVTQPESAACSVDGSSSGSGSNSFVSDETRTPLSPAAPVFVPLSQTRIDGVAPRREINAAPSATGGVAHDADLSRHTRIRSVDHGTQTVKSTEERADHEAEHVACAPQRNGVETVDKDASKPETQDTCNKNGLNTVASYSQTLRRAQSLTDTPPQGGARRKVVSTVRTQHSIARRRTFRARQMPCGTEKNQHTNVRPASLRRSNIAASKSEPLSTFLVKKAPTSTRSRKTPQENNPPQSKSITERTITANMLPENLREAQFDELAMKYGRESRGPKPISSTQTKRSRTNSAAQVLTPTLRTKEDGYELPPRQTKRMKKKYGATDARAPRSLINRYTSDGAEKSALERIPSLKEELMHIQNPWISNH